MDAPSPSSKDSEAPRPAPLPQQQRRAAGGAAPNNNANFFVGTQAIVSKNWKRYRVAPFTGHAYSETGYDMLSEFRESVASTGMNHFKFKLSPNACESYALSCSSDDINSLTELAQVAEVEDTLADPRFKWYHIWLYSWTLRKKLAEDFTDEQLQDEYNEVHALTSHLLQTYQNTGKVFMLGNWEGDWEIMLSSGCTIGVNADFSCAPSPEIISKYIKWASVRQKAIDDAKNEFSGNGVEVFFYIEFNLEKGNQRDHPQLPGTPRPTILNSIVPYVNPDLLSYSSYKSTNRYMDHKGRWFNQTGVDKLLYNILDYAESKLTPSSKNLTGVLGNLNRRVFIGEFSPVRTRSEALFVSSAAQVVRAALEWGCPFVLHWEIFDNNSSALPLIPTKSADLSVYTPLRQLFKDWSDEAQAYVDLNDPSAEALRLWAVEWFRSKY
jgi:hypothetical protein